MKQLYVFLACTLLVTFISACGGGGGGDEQAPVTPTNLQAAPGDEQNTISWDSVSDATSYNIYWNTTGGVTTSDTKISNASSPYNHTSLANATTYYYRVTAANTAGESDLSTQSSATPVDSTPSISGTVAGTKIIAVNASGEIVAQDDTAGKSKNSEGNYPFTLSGIPLGENIRVYLTTDNGAFPLYFGTPATNVFSLSTAVDIDLGFVAIDIPTRRAIPENPPTVVASVNAETENDMALVVLTDKVTGLPLPGATIIVDHATEPRQIGTTSAAGSASFTRPASGPVTVTFGGGNELVSLVSFDLVFLNVEIEDDPPPITAHVEGVVNSSSAIVLANDGDPHDVCPDCENAFSATPGVYRLITNTPNRKFSLSAFHFDGNNFTAVTGLGPLTDGQTLSDVNLTFPVTPPARTTTTGTITVPASLGTLESIVAAGSRNLLGGPGDVLVGIASHNTSPYNYTLNTFELGAAGPINAIIARAVGTNKSSSHSILRNTTYGGTGVDFTLIDVATSLLPDINCGSISPSLSWDGVPGASLYIVEINDSNGKWTLIVDGSVNSVTLPELIGTPLAGNGLATGDPASWRVQAFVLPEYDFNTIINSNLETTYSAFSESVKGECTP